jgi:hypothetical protein
MLLGWSRNYDAQVSKILRFAQDDMLEVVRLIELDR